MKTKVDKRKIFTYAILFDIVKKAISQNKEFVSSRNDVSIFNSIVRTINNHKESQND